MTPVVAAAFLLIGDLIVTKDGKTIDCVIVSQDDENVVYRLPTGTRQLPMAAVARVERRKTLANRYEAAAFYVKAGDSVSYYVLARWCDENGLVAPVERLYEMAGSDERMTHLCCLARAKRIREPEKKRACLESALSMQPDDRAVAEAIPPPGQSGEGFSSGVYSILADAVEQFVSRDLAGALAKVKGLRSKLSRAERSAVDREMRTKLGFGLDEFAERLDALGRQRAYLGGGKIFCPICKGTRYVTCRTCSGKGHIVCAKCKGSGRERTGEACSECGGIGRANCKDCVQSTYGTSRTFPTPEGGSKLVTFNATGKRYCRRCVRYLKGLPRDVVDKGVPLAAAESKGLKRLAACMRDKGEGGFSYEWDAGGPLGRLHGASRAERSEEPLVFIDGKWVSPRVKRLHLQTCAPPPEGDAEWFKACRSEVLAADLSGAARKMSFDDKGVLEWTGLFDRWLWTHGAYYERRKLLTAVFSADEGRGRGYVSPSPGRAAFVVSEGIVLRPEPPLTPPEKFTHVLLYFRIADVERKLTQKDGLLSAGWEVRIEPVFAWAYDGDVEVWRR